MASSFKDLRRRSEESTKILSEQLSKINSGGKTADERYWKPTVDKAGNGSAIIRFLPEPVNETSPFVKLFTHGFQGPGGWYIENSRTTIDETDPVGELNTLLWNSGIESQKEQARKQKRKLNFISNIYVVKDPGNPANEGKVFLFKYGKKIFDMINDLMNPQFDDETKVNPFDLFNGATFRLKQRTGDGGWPSYDKSSFDNPSQLLDDEDELEAIWNKCYSLTEIVDPKNFKSFEELQKRLERVLGQGSTPGAGSTTSKWEEDDDTTFTKTTSQWDDEDEEKPAKTESKKVTPKKPAPPVDDDDDDIGTDWLAKLAEDD